MDTYWDCLMYLLGSAAALRLPEDTVSWLTWGVAIVDREGLCGTGLFIYLSKKLCFLAFLWALPPLPPLISHWKESHGMALVGFPTNRNCSIQNPVCSIYKMTTFKVLFSPHNYGSEAQRTAIFRSSFRYGSSFVTGLKLSPTPCQGLPSTPHKWGQKE